MTKRSEKKNSGGILKRTFIYNKIRKRFPSIYLWPPP